MPIECADIEDMSRVFLCLVPIAVLALSVALVTAIADRAKLQQELAARDTALDEARATILELQVGADSTGTKSSERGFYAERRAQWRRRSAKAKRRQQAAENTAFAAAASGNLDQGKEILVEQSTSATSSSLSATAAEALQRAAAVITSRRCRAEWLREQQADATVPRAHPAPLPFAGGDLELSGVMEAALAARAPGKELIFLSVGDTRDHRREFKDPSLRTISVDFLLNLLANLKRLRIDHYLILTTEPLCRKLQEFYCEYSCVWTSLWHSHPGLTKWNLKPGDMFLMWAQQWRYIARAMEGGYRVLRSDTDVYLAEDPYPILHGPLFSRFEMLSQHDFFGQKERPRCERDPIAPDGDSATSPIRTCGVTSPGRALLNIGLVYLRSRPGGGVYAVINGTWARFVTSLNGQPYRPAHLNGKVETQALIDQPFMRSVVNDLAVPDAQSFEPRKSQNDWAIVPGLAGQTYAAGHECALADPVLCARIAVERRKTAFLVQSVRPQLGRDGTAPSLGPHLKTERVALAPDWLFGRGCLTHLRAPRELFLQARSGGGGGGGGGSSSFSGGTSGAPQCREAPTALGSAPLAPGPAAGLLVATHFVYSMALKRKRAFRAFGWDLGDKRNRTATAPAAGAAGAGCLDTSSRGILFGHTFFDQTDGLKSIVCASPPDEQAPSCSCCTGLDSMVTRAGGRGYRLETTGGSTGGFNPRSHFQALEGCNDYQLFWD